MANVNIDDLTAVSSLTGAELFEVLQTAANKKATTNQVAAALLSRLQVDTSGATITLNFNSFANRKFYGSASFAAAKTIALSNSTNAVELTFFFTITNVAAALTFPSSFTMSDPRWNDSSHVWTSIDTGKFKAKAEFDGTDWHMEIFGPYP